MNEWIPSPAPIPMETLESQFFSHLSLVLDASSQAEGPCESPRTQGPTSRHK